MSYAYHVVFSTYGFWLPNDPRGSGSDFVRNVRLLPYGLATKVNHSYSVAHVQHDRDGRLLAKDALQYPPVNFTHEQIACVARGFEHRVMRSELALWACAIMPDHVHVVLPDQGRAVEQIAGQLKSAGTYQLRAEGLHPLGAFADANGSIPSPWGQGLWTVFLDTHKDVEQAVNYVKMNPIKARFGAQDWGFVVKIGG